MKRLPTTGTSALLEELSPYVPDELINTLLVQKPGPGRPASFSSAQLFRVLLLTLLTPVHSFNLLVELLPEQRAWRSFARLRNRRELPDVRMLHEFRRRLDLAKLRAVNAALLRPLLAGAQRLAKTVALIDSTDLPAATSAYKKTPSANTARGARRWAAAAARTDRAAGISAIKNTRCGCGWRNILPVWSWPR